jgi:orotate phosphoribosyltransferase
MAADIDFDVLFGPAYKGIPLVAATACALADSHERDLPWAFNRKEAKTHGEGGCFVGAGLEGKSVLILDDVITAGTAIRDVMGQLQQVGARPAGVVVALDRAEKGPDSDRSAIQAVRDAFGIPVFSIARLDDLLAWVASDTRLLEFREAMLAYRNQWGVDECT